jgi:general secretion pathway protein E
LTTALNVSADPNQVLMPSRIGTLLVQRGDIAEAELTRALALQAERGSLLGEILVRLGALSEETLHAALGQQTGLPVLAADAPAPDTAAVQAAVQASGCSVHWWARQQAMPWLAEEGVLSVAAVRPWSADLRETLAAQGVQIAAWHYVLPATLERWQLIAQEDGTGAVDERALRELAEDAPVISYVNSLLAQAVDARASDVHIEPGEREFTVRLRIDGVMHTRQTQAMARFAAVASRIKLIAGLDIAERRLPQDGRTSVRVAGAEMDIRVSVIPAVHGESLVLRLLPKRRGDLALERLGMQGDHLAMFSHWLQWPNGMILVTGPTGSGKSTTLYGALSAMNDATRKIVTVEDPVELRLPHLIQIQTQADIGYTFARALRSILRHDPDVIMVGEIRDRETAEIAIQAALTGHLVLATLHTNDALSAVTRLVDMGIEPYLMAASLRAVMAQRLVRCLCERCAVPGEPPEAAAHAGLQGALARWRPGSAPALRLPTGCPACQGTGYRGRRGVYELVPITTQLQDMIVQRLPLPALRDVADQQGRRSLAEDGMLKVLAGETTVDEVVRAAGLSAED